MRSGTPGQSGPHPRAGAGSSSSIELDDHVIAAPVVRDGVERLVEVRHEVDDPIEGLLADGLALAGILEQSEGLLDGRDHAGAPAIPCGDVAGRVPRDVDVVPGAGIRTAGAGLVGPGRDVGEGDTRSEEVGDLALSQSWRRGISPRPLCRELIARVAHPISLPALRGPPLFPVPIVSCNPPIPLTAVSGPLDTLPQPGEAESRHPWQPRTMQPGPGPGSFLAEPGRPSWRAREKQIPDQLLRRAPARRTAYGGSHR
jgi:hypothetical protein